MFIDVTINFASFTLSTSAVKYRYESYKQEHTNNHTNQTNAFKVTFNSTQIKQPQQTFDKQIPSFTFQTCLDYQEYFDI